MAPRLALLLNHCRRFALCRRNWSCGSGLAWLVIEELPNGRAEGAAAIRDGNEGRGFASEALHEPGRLAEGAVEKDAHRLALSSETALRVLCIVGSRNSNESTQVRG